MKKKKNTANNKIKNIEDAKPNKASAKGKKNTGNKAKNIKKATKISPQQSMYITIVIIIILAAAIFVLFKNNNIFELGQSHAKFSQEYSMGIKTDFYVVDKNIYYCSKDGMSFLNNKGGTEWTDTYSMNSPVMLNDGSYAAVADKTSKLLNVYNTSGKLYSANSTGSITTFAVNPIGYGAVISKDDDENGYTLNVYNSNGDTLVSGSYALKDGIPIAIDISDDGKRYAVSFLDISNINIKSKVLFYYTDKKDANIADNSDGVFYAMDFDDNIVNILRFMPNGSCTAISDKQLLNIGGGNTKTYIQNWKIDFENYVTAVDFLDNSYIAVAYGSPFVINESNDKTNTLHWYNYQNGKETGYAKFDSPVTYLSSRNSASIAGMDKTFIAVDIRGKELWKYTALQNVNSIQFYKKLNKVIIATANRMSLYSIKNGAVMVEVNEDESEETTNEQAVNEQTTAVQEQTTQQTTAQEQTTTA